MPLLRFDEEGALLDTLAALSHRNRTVDVQLGGTQLYWSQPFSDTDLWDVSPHGTYIAIVERGMPESFSIRILSTTTGDIGGSEIPLEPTPLTESRIQAALEPALEHARTRPWYSPRFLRRYRDALFIPESCLTATDVLVTDEGMAWVRGPDCEEKPVAPWHVIDRTGRLKARTALPAEASLMHATESSLWIMSTDSIGLPVIHQLSILR